MIRPLGASRYSRSGCGDASFFTNAGVTPLSRSAFLICWLTRRGLRPIGQACSALHRLHSEQRSAIRRTSPFRVPAQAIARMILCGSIPMPTRYLEHATVHWLHWQQQTRARLSISSTGICSSVASSESRGRTRIPLVVFVTGKSGVSEYRPIMGPPSTKTASAGSIPIPPEASRSSRAFVPIGARKSVGRPTAPPVETNVCVTGVPASAPWMFRSVSTLFTTTPTSVGRRPSGTVRPSASAMRMTSSPSG